MKRTTTAVAVLSMLVSGAAWAGEAKVAAKPGKWSLTMTVDMPNMPMQIPPMTFEHCITEKDLVPQTAPNQQCKPTNPKITGSTVEWTIDCKDQNGNPVQGKGKVTYSGEKYDGFMDMTAMGMQLKYKLAGKRVGQCTKEEAAEKDAAREEPAPAAAPAPVKKK